MSSIRIYHDFQKLEGDELEVPGTHQIVRAPLICQGTADDLARLGIELREGMRVVLYQQDDEDEHGNPDFLEVDAVIKRDKSDHYWVGEFDNYELGYASEK